MENTDSNSVNVDVTPAQRPTLVTVIAILSWIMCGLTLIVTLNSMLNPPSQEEIEQSVEKVRQYGGDEAADAMLTAYEKQGSTDQLIANGINLISLLFSALGVALMWQLKRKGFFIYLAGEFLPYLNFVILGADAMGATSSMIKIDPSVIMGATIAIMLVFDAVFIILYGVNLKHMKK